MSANLFTMQDRSERAEVFTGGRPELPYLTLPQPLVEAWWRACTPGGWEGAPTGGGGGGGREGVPLHHGVGELYWALLGLWEALLASLCREGGEGRGEEPWASRTLSWPRYALKEGGGPGSFRPF